MTWTVEAQWLSAAGWWASKLRSIVEDPVQWRCRFVIG